MDDKENLLLADLDEGIPAKEQVEDKKEDKVEHDMGFELDFIIDFPIFCRWKSYMEDVQKMKSPMLRK